MVTRHGANYKRQNQIFFLYMSADNWFTIILTAYKWRGTAEYVPVVATSGLEHLWYQDLATLVCR